MRGWQVKYHYSGRCFAHRIEWGRLLAGNRGVTAEIRLWCVEVGGQLLVETHFGCSDLRSKLECKSSGDPWLRDIGQMGSLAGAAHLLYVNAGVLRHAP